jgi:dimethylamine/trimethylamine dehydrogenase
MMNKRDPRYDILFEPVKIGPVTAPNRFYQVPHCTGMGHMHPRSMAALRGMKAEGGWGVVCTEYCSIHPTSDESPFNYASIWDEGDVTNLRLMTDAVHDHGSLAGVELWHGGSQTSNRKSHAPSLGLQSTPSLLDPIQSRKMDKADIADLRIWHRDAVRRARQAGFDIVYVYACHHYLLSEFLSRTTNTRTDEYGGGLENRVRLIRELIEEALEEAAGQMAVAVRYSADGQGDDHMTQEEALESLAMLGELPDLWDLVVSDYGHEMGSSRFVNQGTLEPLIAKARAQTTKPIVSVGRFTSPDAMVSQVKRGVLDLIGAARPSIADPFLPAKIRDGRMEDIRECIGCNICYAGDSMAVPMRCTQNPTIGEEWRQEWHPENVDKIGTDTGTGSVLVVGAGPAGLEAAHILGKRGYEVTLADAALEAGGRVSRESRLPGLAEWARVRDYRLEQIKPLVNVELYLDSYMAHDDVLAFGASHVVLATGAKWRKNGQGRTHLVAVDAFDHASIFSPDDIMDGTLPHAGSPVCVFDDDHYYMGVVMAEAMATHGCRVTYVTSSGRPASWSSFTTEQEQAHARLLDLDIQIITNHAITNFGDKGATATCTVSGNIRTIEADALIPVTSREPTDTLFHALNDDPHTLQANGIQTLVRAGDCDTPGIIAMAVQAGHRIARQLGEQPPDLKRDRYTNIKMDS